jgi:lipopolysaccharide export system permease protein
MKTLDLYVLRSFIRPFVATFLIMVLFLLMQFVWKYIDDLVGRGVEWYYIGELLFYTSATVVPMALPLAILLSSIMTFGSLGEHNEMAALKANGVSLIRAMQPIIFFILFLALCAFLFSNYVIPVANLKSETLLRNITNLKPALNIQQGVFYKGLEGYSIKVGEKYGSNQNQLRNVFIYDHTDKQGNNKVISAKGGKMSVTEDELFLNIELDDGTAYEDVYAKKPKDRDNLPFIRSSFTKNLIRFNLADFQSGDLRSGKRKDYDMLNVLQLNEAVDSLNENYKSRRVEFNKGLKEKYAFARYDDEKLEPYEVNLESDILANINENERYKVIQNALRISRSNKTYFQNLSREYDWREKLITRHLLEWQKKFSISFSCIVLFFIGAPLGAIIRKGGMGMPVVVSVLIFIIYHVTSFSFEKLGREMVWTPFQAMWTASFMLLPFGIFLTYKSATDSALFNVEVYLKPFQKISSIFASSKK